MSPSSFRSATSSSSLSSWTMILLLAVAFSPQVQAFTVTHHNHNHQQQQQPIRVVATIPQPQPPRHSWPTTTQLWGSGGSSSAFSQQPGESQSDYFKRITHLASDATLFEQAVSLRSSNSHQSSKDGKSSSTTARHYSSNADNHNEPNDNNNNNPKDEEQQPQQQRRGYVRAEDWDHEQRNRKVREGMSWDERVQYDGLRFGNQVQQNDILRHHLKGF